MHFPAGLNAAAAFWGTDKETFCTEGLMNDEGQNIGTKIKYNTIKQSKTVNGRLWGV